MQNDPKIIPTAQHAPPRWKTIPRLYWIGGAIAGGLLMCLMCGVGIGGWWLAGSRAPGIKEQGNERVKSAKPKTTKPVGEWNYQDIQDHLADTGFKTSRGQGKRGMWFEPAGTWKTVANGPLWFEPDPAERLGDGDFHQEWLGANDLLQGDGGAEFRDVAPMDKVLLQKAAEDYGDLFKKEGGITEREFIKFRLLRRETWTRSPISPFQPFLATDHGSPAAAKKETERIKDIEQREVLAWQRFVFQGGPEALKTLKKLLP